MCSFPTADSQLCSTLQKNCKKPPMRLPSPQQPPTNCCNEYGVEQNNANLSKTINAYENYDVPKNIASYLVKPNSEMKMHICNPNAINSLYANVEKFKELPKKEGKINKSIIINESIPIESNVEISYKETNYVNVNRTNRSGEPHNQSTDICSISESIKTANYANIEFVQSLEFYENARDLINKTATIQLDNKLQNLTAENSFINGRLQNSKTEFKYCNKCGHLFEGFGSTNGHNNGDSINKSTVQDDYLVMGPSMNNILLTDCYKKDESLILYSGHKCPVYLPMSRDTVCSANLNTAKQDLLKQKLNQGIRCLVKKAISVPSLLTSDLNSNLIQKHLDSEFTPTSVILNSNQNISELDHPNCDNKIVYEPKKPTQVSRSRRRYVRKRSSSADSTGYGDNLEFIKDKVIPSSYNILENSEINIKKNSGSTSSNHIVNHEHCSSVECEKGINIKSIESVIKLQINEDVKDELIISHYRKKVKSNMVQTSFEDCLRDTEYKRRSSAISFKLSNYNRDSFSSNDSGVSTTSLIYKKTDFSEFELPLTTSKSSRRHDEVVSQRFSFSNGGHCIHDSLPRRSKSLDPLEEPSPIKSLYAGPDVSVYSNKRDSLKVYTDYWSPSVKDPITASHLDSRSTSSTTSDMSDYFESLSLSSHSSSDNPESLRRGRLPSSTLRPRSGKEYLKFNQDILEDDVKKSELGVITTVLEKAEH